MVRVFPAASGPLKVAVAVGAAAPEASARFVTTPLTVTLGAVWVVVGSFVQVLFGRFAPEALLVTVSVLAPF